MSPLTLRRFSCSAPARSHPEGEIRKEISHQERYRMLNLLSSSKRFLLPVVLATLIIFVVLGSISTITHPHLVQHSAHSLTHLLHNTFNTPYHPPPSPPVPVPPPPRTRTYRQLLEERESTPHSPTLGFDKILVLSLPGRADRRERMLKLGRALGLELEFVDAVDKTSDLVRWIGERVWEMRERKREILVSGSFA